MDNPWRIKFDSTLQSSMLSMASSASQEPRDQMEMNYGQYFRQHTTQDLSSTLHERVHDPMRPNNSNLFSHKSSQSELANSFLALLSGPPSLLQCDLQELSSRKVFNASRYGNINDFASETPRAYGTLLSENWSKQNTENGGNCSAVPSRLELSSSSSGVSVLPCNFHASNVNIQASDLAEVVNHHMVPGTEKVMDFATLKGDCYGTGSAKAGNPHSKNIRMSMKIPEELNSSIADQSSTILSGCPRVFCLGTGLCDMNPGDVVHMESGGTIARWRKLYFEKFGIRVPEDQSGWDWPEGLLPTTGLVKSSSTVPKISITSHVANPIGSSQALSSLLDVADGRRMECAFSKSSTMSTFGGRDSANGCQSVSTWIDSISKTRNPSLAHSSLQNLRTLGRNYDATAAKITGDILISDRDAASSNVELKLGQPYQPSQPIGNSALPVVAPKHFKTVVDPPKSYHSEKMVDRATFCGKEETRQYCLQEADSSNTMARSQQSLLNFCKHAFAASSFVDATKPESRLDATKNLVVPACSPLPLEGSACSKGSNNMVSEFSMPKIFHCGSSTTKCDPLNAPLKIGNSLGRQLNMPELGFCRLTEKGKGAGLGCLPVGFSDAIDPALRIHKQVESSRIAIGMMPGFSSVHDMNSCQSSNISSGRFDERSCLNLPGNSSFVGNNAHTDQDFLTMSSSYLGSRHISQPSAATTGFLLATSTFVPGSTSTTSKQEGPCLLDDSMRLLALSQISELSKRHAISSVGMSHELGRLDRTSNPNIQHSLLESSKSREGRCGSILPSRQDVFEGLSSCCDFSQLTQGLPLHSRIDMPCQFSNDRFCDQSTLRLIRGESITQSSGHAKCCQRVPCTYSWGDCICSVHVKCLEGYTKCRFEGSCVVSKEQVGVCCEAHNPAASEFVKEHINPNDRTNLLDQGGKVNGQLPMRIACHASQWRDVPSKQKEACKMTQINSSAELLDASGCAGDQFGAAAGVNGVGSAINEADSLKWQGMSNISSGCSGAAVTQASTEVNNVDSSTIDAGDNEYRNDLVVDEGSGIDKCSSNDELESERSAEFIGVSCRNKIRNNRSSKIPNGQSSLSLLDELKLLDSLTWKKGQNQSYMSLSGIERINHVKKIRKGLKGGKRKRATKFRMLDMSFAPKLSLQHCPKGNGSHHMSSRSSKDWQTLIPSVLESYEPTHLIRPGELASAKIACRKRGFSEVYNDQDGEDYQVKLKGDDRFDNILEVSGRKRLKQNLAYNSFEKLGSPKPLRTVEKTSNSDSVYCTNAFSCFQTVCDKKVRPIVCGEYGEICSCKSAAAEFKPPKIVPLSRVIQSLDQCNLRKSCKPKITSRMSNKKRTATTTGYLSSDLKKEEENGAHHVSFFDEVSGCLVEEGKKTCLREIKQFHNKSFILEKGNGDGSEKSCVPDAITCNWSNARCKESRKRSLSELTGKGKESRSDSYPPVEISMCMPRMKARKGLNKADDVECRGHRSCDINPVKAIDELRCSSSADSDAFCCVCGSSNKDEFNLLLECSQCSIRVFYSSQVHQACYGVSKVPKGQWYCRPCRTNSKDIVCVLCGYGGGAMTRALQSHTFVKGLLKAWNIESECRPKDTVSSAETMVDDQSLVVGKELCNLQCKDLGLSRTAVWKMDMQNSLNNIQNSPCSVSKLNVYNSVIAGVLDPSVRQWVHMVCGLWTPGTRCPNVNTMSAFDVSGVSRGRENVVCSICSRSGGSCIQCRVVDCSVRFHPWCAHQKGLLQSEVEGLDNESVGFYGRCMLHALHPICKSDSDPTNGKLSFPRKGESTCARTEGFKGRKQDGFWHNPYGQSRRKNGCFVPQEQLNAWIHINGQKPYMQRLPKLSKSDIENDCRKEYARYKQAKGWKHLVVYKSGIHALGLYTSRFISRGEMVVEYVGEIVGQHVADKRELEYLSGRKVQYKSACYFFRIDKEHIIDATRKGGIARFVNHSCLPNCVAKVISVKNEKKVIPNSDSEYMQIRFKHMRHDTTCMHGYVVFFAERDIYPGEEITYDYHFNHEDEVFTNGFPLILSSLFKFFHFLLWERRRLQITCANVWCLAYVLIHPKLFLALDNNKRKTIEGYAPNVECTNLIHELIEGLQRFAPFMVI
ncbi:SET domain-containing protein/PHD_2 domain-containing protein/zf-HC5HC2H_2 domain-containing protein [Gossypium australe]|uniref:SET domain-containing protein/PHD_2 domain-containing protein/zf-HC5HC2H_2 domain-containing protein n=1 Tax=Gossypium australe TaxID=47621 RepID=A0A5B6UML0_9ROSI|nr:SET domain-containing protein/PHD_2 domain-containing protein/zf-HC5HC2H_2 domain-containing protein [Gossypium australe]